MPAPNTVLLICVLASFSTPFTLSALNVALPAMALDLHLDARGLGWVSLSFLLASAALLVPMGRLADIFGRKRLFTSGFAIFTAASLACGLAVTPWQFFSARVIQGAGSAMVFGTAVAILTSVFPPERRGKALGWVSAAVYTGLSFGPPAGGLLTDLLSWRAIFLVNVPLGLLVLWLVRRGLAGAEWRGAEGESFDLAGAALYAGALALLMYGLSSAGEKAGPALAAAGAAGLFIFLRRETRVAHPVLNASLFLRNRVFAFSNLAAFLNYSATFAAGFLLSLYLQYREGLSPRQAGLLLAVQPVLMAVFSPWAGRLSDRRDPGVIASAGMALTAAGIACFWVGAQGLPAWRIAAGLAVTGLGLALFAAPNTNAVMGSVERAQYSVASATLGTMRLTGQMFSMAAVLLLFSLLLGRVRLDAGNAAALGPVMNAAVALFAGLCAAGILASLKRRR